MEPVKYLLGNFGDNAWLIWEGLRLGYKAYNSSYFGLFGFENTQVTTEPLSYLPFLFLSKFFNAIDLWNLFVILFIFLNLFFSFKLFHKVKKNIILGIIFSFLWVSNSYFSIHSRDHLSLLTSFLFPIYLLIQEKNNNKYLLLKNIFIFICLLFSTYIGIFVLISNVFMSTYNIIKNKKNSTKIDFFLSILLVLTVSISAKYLFPDSSRNIDNFLIFSSKPWNFFIQSNRALINISDFEKYLSPNNIYTIYFDNEHSVTYFSITLAAIFFFKLVTKKIKFNKELYFLFFLILISFPPFILIKGVNIYLPSFIFYELFPQLRVLARINIFSYLIFLKIILESIDWENLTSNKKYLYYLLFVFAFIELQVPYKITTFQNNKVYDFIKNKTDISSQIIFYPNDLTDEALKNMIYYQRKVVNPSSYELNNFKSKDFTKNLSCNEIKKFIDSTDNLYLIKKVGTNMMEDDSEFIVSDQGISLYKVNCK